MQISVLVQSNNKHSQSDVRSSRACCNRYKPIRKSMRLLALFIGLFTFQLSAMEIKCKGNVKLVDSCYETRGKIFAANGNPTFRMWKVGTKRILGIVYSEDPIVPKKLNPYLGWGFEIFGDYLVCPFSKEQPGHMQFVCIESADNLRIEDSRENHDKPKIIHLK